MAGPESSHRRPDTPITNPRSVSASTLASAFPRVSCAKPFNSRSYHTQTSHRRGPAKSRDMEETGSKSINSASSHHLAPNHTTLRASVNYTKILDITPHYSIHIPAHHTTCAPSFPLLLYKGSGPGSYILLALSE